MANFIIMAKTQFDIPAEINKLLRMYVIEYGFRSREEASVFILKNFLFEIYKIEKKEKNDKQL